MTAPPQLSPDGRWWWDGTQWVPASAAPSPAPAAPEEAAGAADSPWSQPGTTEGQPAGGTTAGPPWAQASGSTAPGGPGYAAPGYGAPAWGQQGYQTPYGAAPAYGYAPASSGNDGKAIASLVLGLTWVFWLGSIAAIVLGHVSRAEAKRENRPPSGMALAGLILGYIGIAALALFILMGAVFGTVFKDEIGDALRADTELLEAGDAQGSFHARHQRYAGSVEELQESGFQPDPSVDFVIHAADATSYCMSAEVFGARLYISEQAHATTGVSCV